MAMTEGTGGGRTKLVVVVGLILLAVTIYLGTQGKPVDEPPRPWHSESPASK